MKLRELRCKTKKMEKKQKNRNIFGMTNQVIGELLTDIKDSEKRNRGSNTHKKQKFMDP